jgi:hypothetical protein
MRKNHGLVIAALVVVSATLIPTQSFGDPVAAPGNTQGNGPCLTSGSTNSQTQSVKNLQKACGDGGIGTAGPGGGIIFYYYANGFACGPTLTSSICYHLEVAPNTWSGGAADPAISWSTNVFSNQTTAVAGADGTVIGSGFQNSLDIVNQSGNVAATSAAVAAREYTGGGMNDWYLPARAEINELCKYARGQRTGDVTQACASTGTLIPGFAADPKYWSSSEFSNESYPGNTAWYQNFSLGNQSNYFKSYNGNYVRPVRAY